MIKVLSRILSLGKILARIPRTGIETRIIISSPFVPLMGKGAAVEIKTQKEKRNSDLIIVGGRLGLFWPKWQKPPLTNFPIVMESYQGNPGKHLALQKAIQELLDKGVLEEVFDTQSPGFYGRLFLRPKPDGSWRKIIDLSGLNDYIWNPSFRMETVMGVQSGLRRGMWAASIDLTDAYYHLPIRKTFRKFFRVALMGRVFQFRAMPMGLNVAARVFTKVIAQMLKVLRQEGIMIHAYLDDWLIKAYDRQVLVSQVNRVLMLCDFLGLKINWEKSELVPSQDLEYLGVHFNLLEGIARVPCKRIGQLEELIHGIFRQGGDTARGWSSLIGKMSSMSGQIRLGQLHRRPVQRFLRQEWKQESQNWEDWIPANQEVKSHLMWWLDRNNTQVGVPLIPFLPSLTMHTDASLVGYGVAIGDYTLSGMWTPEESSMHSNNREMLAVIRGFQHFKDFVSHKQVLICSDNTTTVSTINRQGGTRSWALTNLAWELWDLVDSVQCQIWARFIPGRLNAQADWLSRGQQTIPTEWSLSDSVLQEVWKVWGVPRVDLFATHLNHKLPRFVSPFPHKEAWKVNAFSFQWGGDLLYAFPPWVIMQEVLQKLWDDQGEMILVAPTWSTRPWFPMLIQMSVKDPILLPLKRDLLIQEHSGKVHPNLASLMLQAWRLSGQH
jgi:ribonuclease HI